ncbi:leukemia NUP98 fusion partner 1 [Willisornis vidua]|uniref:Leukemia NUP98 fusion partner 1 n=1 Tax=Willisornis vidua TaxID=1566151 RepID=A0ABQ9D646_9PASS|nr:leukemia NUP98 fusion partner 1 [Willisornis vidua]
MEKARLAAILCHVLQHDPARADIPLTPIHLCLCQESILLQNSVKLLAWRWNLTLLFLIWLRNPPPSLEHLYMEYDEDEDIFFAKWMSSFWGHNLIDENEKEGRGHKKRQTRFCNERRASLPAKLSSFHATRLHDSAKGSSSGHLKGSKEFQEDQDVKCHCHRKASRTPSADSSGPETRSNSIQEFAESFEKQLHLKSKRSISLVGDNQLKITP